MKRAMASHDRAIFAVLGDPVSHSLSPVIHNAAFRAAGRRAVYVARRVTREECGPVLRSLALGGGGGNVTVPHKEAVLPFLDRCTTAVTATGACNTFWAEDGVVWGDNTDVEGFRETWKGVCGGLDGPLEVLLLGAGGAARAVLFALLGSGRVSRILLWNRTREKGLALARHFAGDRVRSVEEYAATGADVVVNATSVGMDAVGMPLDPGRLATPPRRIIDLVYGERPTPLCRYATGIGVPATDGLGMLVGQAEASYARWFGEPAPEGAMARALARGREATGRNRDR